jgi:hypothetical protein
MTQNGIQWIKTPEQLVLNIQRYGQLVLAVIYAVAVRWGQIVQDSMRRSAPWEDRTGNARSGLFFAVDGFGFQPFVGQVTPGVAELNTDHVTIEGSKDSLIITAGHTVFYGKYLELNNGGKHAVVMSTIEAHLPQLERNLQEVFR